MPDFKGYINDVGGPTANFRYPSCEKQKECGVCPSKKCLAPKPCKNLTVDHTEYKDMLSEIEKIDGIKKVFIRSGIRFDYLLYDEDDSFFRQLVTRHVSGQLKVAPEHCAANALMMMGKPTVEVFEQFKKKYFKLCGEAGLEQYLVPYLMSSHPGTTINDAVEMALWLKRWGYSPEQVQDFYPTPGTISTAMYYTGIHPMTGKSVSVTTDYHEKQLQRALLQYSRPENANLVREALKLAGREDLIGNGKDCLVRAAFGQNGKTQFVPDKRRGTKGRRTAKSGTKGGAGNSKLGAKSGAKSRTATSKLGAGNSKSNSKLSAGNSKSNSKLGAKLGTKSRTAASKLGAKGSGKNAAKKH